jgi:hypothetical protein
MGKKGPLTLVTPTEFKERTSLRLHSRSGTTLKVDAAYAAYWESQSDYKKNQLHRVLGEYLVAHGGSWNLCDRNTVSGGLLEWLHNEVAPDSVRMTPEKARALDLAAATRIRDIEIPHSRYGVLYFLANIELDMDIASVVIEGMSTVGGAIGTGFGTDFGQMGNAAKASKTAFTAVGQNVKASHLVGAGTAVLGVAKSASATGGKVARQPVPIPPKTWFPTSEAALNKITKGLSETYDNNRYLGAAAYVGAGLASPIIATGALIADGALAIARAARALWDAVKKALGSVGRIVLDAWQNRGSIDTAKKAGTLIKACTKFILDLVMKNALPFLGGAMDIGKGLVRTIDEACTRVASWYDRRRIRVQLGHPEEMANAIEHQMDMGMLKGLGEIFKGATKAAVGTFLPGLGSLVTVVMSAIEWMIKLIYRLLERSAIGEFLKKARAHYKTEKDRAQLEPGPARGVRGNREPNTQPGGLITNTAAFTEFFQEGCKASPIIPMLTLNSGLAGSLMTMVELFEADGSQSSAKGGSRTEFDIAGSYFNRLKLYSVGYLKTCGFKFRPLDPDDNLLRGFLQHATGARREQRDVNGKVIGVSSSHAAPVTWVGRGVAIAGA